VILYRPVAKAARTLGDGQVMEKRTLLAVAICFGIWWPG
jgi:hypothetical protein